MWFKDEKEEKREWITMGEEWEECERRTRFLYNLLMCRETKKKNFGLTNWSGKKERKKCMI